jgi:amino acid transporter
MAENRMLPAWFAHIHPKFATPDRSILLMAGMALVLALSGSFVKLAVASSLVRLLSYIVSIASLPAVRRKADEETRRNAYRLKGGYTIPIIGLAICSWLLAQSRAESWKVVSILLAIGGAMYAAEKWFGSGKRAA